MPFGAVATMAPRQLGVQVSEATVRRLTEQAGTAAVASQTAALTTLLRELPTAPDGPERQQVSVDGAMVPLRGGVWAEVKTLAIGTLPSPCTAGTGLPLGAISYFSRMTDHETFGHLATLEVHRRGTENAGTVIAVVDGADWIQGFLDMQCAKAVRVLDWGHASGYVARAGQARYGPGTEAASEWVGVQLQTLRHGDPEHVLAALREAHAFLEGGSDPGACSTVATSLAYLEKRLAQVQYATFEAACYPIGSGVVESGNKLVVEVRLKGAGMHWAPRHVDPMLALRNALCSDRWEEVWEQIQVALRLGAHHRTAQRRAARAAARAAERTADPPTTEPTDAVAAVAPTPGPTERSRKKTIINGRPTEDHPWKGPLLHQPLPAKL